MSMSVESMSKVTEYAASVYFQPSTSEFDVEPFISLRPSVSCVSSLTVLHINRHEYHPEGWFEDQLSPKCC